MNARLEAVRHIGKRTKVLQESVKHSIQFGALVFHRGLIQERMQKLLFLFVCFVFGNLSALSENDFEKIFQKHSKNLSYLDESHDKLLIFFSGVPAMGKTTVAKKLEETFHGVRICADEVRAIIRGLSMEGHVDSIVDPYVQWLLRKITKSYSNHFLILDRSIDRKYNTYLPFIEEFSYDTFLVQLIVPRNLVEERIRQRGIETEWFLNGLDSYWREYEQFNQTHMADYLFNNENRTEDSIEGLVEQIHHRYNFP